MNRQHPRSTLFPYTTLFRSDSSQRAKCRGVWERGTRQKSPNGIGLWHMGSVTRSQDRQSLIPRDFVPLCDRADRKSTRLNSSHSQISYAVFCLKKKKK